MSIPQPKIRELRYLYTIKQTGRVVAHCLDIDTVTAADDIDEAERRLDCLVRLQIEDALATGTYAALAASAAPKKYFDHFAECVRAGRIREGGNPTLKKMSHYPKTGG